MSQFDLLLLLVWIHPLASPLPLVLALVLLLVPGFGFDRVSHGSGTNGSVISTPLP